MIADYFFALRMWAKFRTYRPQKVTPKSALRWLRQFDASCKTALRKAAYHLHFVSEKDFVGNLLDRNRALLGRLRESGVALSDIIYVSIGEAGSSSHAALNLIRDHARLQIAGCKFADGRSNDALRELTNELGEGVIIYIDDFAGTGSQFCDEQARLSSFILGNFSQYFLVHTACEEAIEKIDGVGVVPWHYTVHKACDRPLHEDSNILAPQEKRALVDLSLTVARGKRGALGVGDLAVSIVFYQNIPNNAPRIFRGDNRQRHYLGLVPRTTDLPRPVF